MASVLAHGGTPTFLLALAEACIMYGTGLPPSLPREIKKKSDIGTAKEERQVTMRQLEVLLTYIMPEKLFHSLPLEHSH